MKTKICPNCKRELSEDKTHYVFYKRENKFYGSCRECRNHKYNGANYKFGDDHSIWKDETKINKLIQMLSDTNLSVHSICKTLEISTYVVYEVKTKFNIIRFNNSKVKNPIVLCKWCKKEFRPVRFKNRPNRGKYCSKECYRQWQLSPDNKRENNPNWKEGGKHEKEIHSLRHSPQWKEWREKVFKRDNYCCKFCSKAGKLEPHHIYPRRDNIDKVFDIDNGITLCRNCHKDTINKEYEYIDKCLEILKCNEALLLSGLYRRR